MTAISSPPGNGRGAEEARYIAAAMVRSLVLMLLLAAVGCAPTLLIHKVDPVASKLRMPDWIEPWNGDTLVVGTAVVDGMSVESRPTRTRTVVRVRYHWSLTPLGKDYLYSLGCGRPVMTIESVEQAICDYAGGHYYRNVDYLWDKQAHAWLAGPADVGPGAERRAPRR